MPEANDSTSPTVSEIYKEQYAHFRGMNDILYKIPPLFTAVIGGLWYVAIQNFPSDKWLARVVLIFAALSCVGFVQVMRRFGMAFKLYITRLMYRSIASCGKALLR